MRYLKYGEIKKNNSIFVPEMIIFMRWIKSLERTGISEETSELNKMFVTLTNRGALVYFFFSLTSIFVTGIFVPFVSIYPMILITCTYLFTFVFNYYQYYESARYNSWVVTLILIFWMSSTFGYESNSHLLLFIVILTTVIAFEFKPVRHLIFLISIPVIELILLYLTDFSLFRNETISASVVKIISINISFSTAIGLGIAALNYRTEFEQRTLKIKASEEAIKAKNIELKKTNEELDAFIYRVSHDLRAPIASAIGLVGLCKSDKENTGYYLDLQENSLNKLEFFINDVLHYSRNKRMELNISEMNLEKIVDDSVSLMQHDENYIKVKIIRDFHHSRPFYTDGFRVQIIINNLISNAFRYHDKLKPNPYIKISTTSDDEKLQIKVSDNGLGIPEKYLPRVFDMFYRASKNSKGSGLGLYIAKEAVLALKGEITVTSIENQGTTFNVIIPKTQQEKKHP